MTPKAAATIGVGLIIVLFLIYWITQENPNMEPVVISAPPQPTVIAQQTMSYPTSPVQVSPIQIHITTTTLNRPVASPYGVITGNPIEDTGTIWIENDVVGIFSRSSARYLTAVDWQHALPESLDQGGEVILQATAVTAHDQENSQWIVRKGDPQFPQSIKFENALYRGLFLSVIPGYHGRETKTNIDPLTDWHWSLGPDSVNASVYSTLFGSVAPTSLDFVSSVIYSAPLAQNYTVITRNTDVFLANNSVGEVVDEHSPTIPDSDLKYEKHSFGRINPLTGDISRAGTSKGLQSRWQIRRETETQSQAEL